VFAPHIVAIIGENRDAAAVLAEVRPSEVGRALCARLAARATSSSSAARGRRRGRLHADSILTNSTDERVPLCLALLGVLTGHEVWIEDEGASAPENQSSGEHVPGSHEERLDAARCSLGCHGPRLLFLQGTHVVGFYVPRCLLVKARVRPTTAGRAFVDR